MTWLQAAREGGEGVRGEGRCGGGGTCLPPSHPHSLAVAAAAAAPHHRAQPGQEAHLQNSYVRVFVCKTIQRLLGTTRGVHQRNSSEGRVLETGSGVSLSSYQCRTSLAEPPRVPKRGHAAAQPSAGPRGRPATASASPLHRWHV